MPAIPSPRSGRKPRLEIIPFIDIMFFLLATFMMVSLSLIHNQGIELNLPGATSARPQEQTDHTQTVSVAKSGELFLNKEPITLPFCRKDSVSLSPAIRRPVWSCKATMIAPTDSSSRSSTAHARED